MSEDKQLTFQGTSIEVFLKQNFVVINVIPETNGTMAAFKNGVYCPIIAWEVRVICATNSDDNDHPHMVTLTTGLISVEGQSCLYPIDDDDFGDFEYYFHKSDYTTER